MASSWKSVHTKVWGRKYVKNVFVRSNPDDLKFIFMEINIVAIQLNLYWTWDISLISRTDSEYVQFTPPQQVNNLSCTL